MKKIQYILVVLFVLGIATTTQAQKVGYFDLESVLPQLSDYQSAKAEMETYAKQVENEIKAKQTEFETKLKDYQEKLQAGTLTPAIQAAKERELQSLDRNFQTFQQNIQLDIQQRESNLLTPIYEKIEKAIKDVAESNGYAYILKAEFLSGVNKSNNISDLVLAKLK